MEEDIDLTYLKDSFGHGLVTLACTKEEDYDYVLKLLKFELEKAAMIENVKIRNETMHNISSAEFLFKTYGGNKKNGCIIFAGLKIGRYFEVFTQPMKTNYYSCDFNFDNKLIREYIED